MFFLQLSIFWLLFFHSRGWELNQADLLENPDWNISILQDSAGSHGKYVLQREYSYGILHFQYSMLFVEEWLFSVFSHGVFNKTSLKSLEHVVISLSHGSMQNNYPPGLFITSHSNSIMLEEEKKRLIELLVSEIRLTFSTGSFFHSSCYYRSFYYEVDSFQLCTPFCKRLTELFFSNNHSWITHCLFLPSFSLRNAFVNFYFQFFHRS